MSKNNYRRRHRRRGYPAWHVGRLRHSVADFLSDTLEREVFPEKIQVAQGPYRTDWRHDVYRWEFFLHFRDANKNGGFGYVGCWNTMTEFWKRRKEPWYIWDSCLYMGVPDACAHACSFIHASDDGKAENRAYIARHLSVRGS